ncbi:MAG: Plug and carboxypeptidase regulatory-like domain-containing protein [Bryobacteraceae bacterium]|nr:Plug and carboxypeptidase regulatory-like domain-containing protein [Bryobacteraceae bacterium]MDW8377243.1 carboxypeptidase regulatory-like domain-containing protein [Bryobacterales bacterium]
MAARNLRLASLLVTSCLLLRSQTIHSTLTGVVVDSSGAVVPGVTVEAIQANTGFLARATSNAQGEYILPLLPAGVYTVRVEHSGFAPVKLTNIVLRVGERHALDIQLRVGTQTESITVTADAGQLQLKSESGERSEILTNRQIRDLALNGRNILDLMKLIPGVVSSVNAQVSSDSGLRNFNVNGARGTQNEVSIDGAPNVLTGARMRVHVTVNPDALQEVRILTSNYQAEFGRAGGGLLVYTTRSGTKDFRLGARYFRRHDSLNANNFFNNTRGLPRPLYRYDYYGYDVSGPVRIPGTKFNQNRDKLFFFWAQEWYDQLIPQSARLIRVPTLAERRGDFAETTDGNGNPIVIRDPLSGQPFPGNRIPAARLFRDGPALLALFPQPNDPTGGVRYNYSSQISGERPRREDILRIDGNLHERLRLFGRFISNSEIVRQPYGGAYNITYNVPLTKTTETQAPRNLALNSVTNIGARLVNEFQFAFTRSRSEARFLDDGLTRSRHGLSFPLLFRADTEADVLPAMTFGGIAQQTFPNLSVSPTPRPSSNPTLSLSNNLSWFQGKHAAKFGLLFLRSDFNFQPANPVNGDINFSHDVNNPLNAQHPFANALLGVFTQFQQANSMPMAHIRYFDLEFFAQDTWKLRRNLTLDLGLRVSFLPPQYERQGNSNIFALGRFDPSRAVRLYTPLLVGGQRRAIDPGAPPLTPTLSNTLPATFINLIVPESGDPFNGLISLRRENYPRGGFEGQGAHLGPRFGFAWSPHSDNRTVLRGGFGISFDRLQNNLILATVNTPPTNVLQRVLFNTLDQLPTVGRGMLAPFNVFGFPKTLKTPYVMSYSLGVQRNLGAGVVLDAAFVSSQGRHLIQSRNLNVVPYFATFERWAQDPSQYPNNAIPAEEPGLATAYQRAGFAFSGARSLPADFLRPYRGITAINYREASGSSNYHALQLSAQRRLGRLATFGVNYTWSRAFNSADADFDGNHPFQTRAYDYSPAGFDRGHVFTANYVIDIPRGSRLFKGGLLGRMFLDGWQVSGISLHYSGLPAELGMAIQGVNVGQRVVGSHNLPVRPYRVGGAPMRGSGIWVNPDAFYAPDIGDIGPYPRMYLRLPGFLNHDLSVFKNVQLGESGREFNFV